MLKLLRVFLAPERLYMAALGLSGLAALLTIGLSPYERGMLAVTMTGATLGSAIGGISIDTFLLSRPKGWVWARGGVWIVAMLIGCILLSGAVAAAIIAYARGGSYTVAISAAGCLTVFNACSSLALRVQKFRFVYATRAFAALILISGYVLFYVNGVHGGLEWSTAYLAGQAAAAFVLTVAVVRWAIRNRPAGGAVDLIAPEKSRLTDISDMGKIHVGISAQMVTSRLDQVLISHLVGPAAVGVYALAVAAMEFAQASAVVRSQRILIDRSEEATTPRMRPVVLATLPIAVCSVLGLAALGLLKSDYDEAWVFGLLLLPGAVASALGKTWSAALLIRRGEAAASAVAVVTAAVAVPLYYVFVSGLGAHGAAVAVSCAYTVYALGAFWSLRVKPRLPVEQVV